MMMPTAEIRKLRCRQEGTRPSHIAGARLSLAPGATLSGITQSASPPHYPLERREIPWSRLRAWRKEATSLGSAGGEKVTPGDSHTTPRF